MQRIAPALLLLVLSVSTCVSCTGLFRPDALEVVRSRTESKDAAVALVVRCSNFPEGMLALGSGVIVSRTEVLTAAHVVECLGEDGTSGEVVDALAFAGDVGVRVVVDAVAAPNDVARLKIADDAEFPPVGPVRVGSVSEGSSICIYTGAPSRDVRCGQIEDVVRNRTKNDLAIGVAVEPGNSGSAVYDRFGRLVGIVTQRRALQNGQSSGGMASSLGRHPIMGIVR